MFTKKKIFFFSGNRSDYSIQEPIIKTLTNNKNYNISLILTGSHTNGQMVGSTIKHINQKSLKKIYKINIDGDFNSTHSILKFNNEFQEKFSYLLQKNTPDFMVLTGDRYETFCAGFSSFLMRIPIIHIEGGDMTLGGTYDDVIRHSLSRLSSFHFVTNDLSKKRIIKWDEKKNSIFNIGYPPGIEIRNKKFASKKEIESTFHLKKGEKIIIFTLHPIINSKTKNKDYKTILKVLKTLSKSFKIIITYPNFDPGYKDIIKLYDNLNKNKNILIKKNLGKFLYYGILNYCGNYNIGFCMGNSSSGIKEAIFFNCPVIDIGDRQLGRLSPTNVKNVKFQYRNIILACKTIVKSKKNRFKVNPYKIKNFDQNILNIFKKICKKKNSELKKFNI